MSLYFSAPQAETTEPRMVDCLYCGEEILLSQACFADMDTGKSFKDYDFAHVDCGMFEGTDSIRTQLADVLNAFDKIKNER